MSRLNMRGSVASFVVVGAVLAALLLGSIYVVKTQLSTTVSDIEQEVAVETTATDDATNDTASESSDDATTQDKQTETNTTTNTDTTTEADTTDKQTTVVEEATNDEEAMPATGVTVDELPTTGPAETFGMILALGTLAASITYYRRSLSAKA